jgi:O-antigen/teichoic acid export membrane protein
VAGRVGRRLRQITNQSPLVLAAGHAVGFNMLALVANLVSGIIIARGLGTTGRGTFVAVTIGTSVAAQLFSLGCARAVAFREAREPGRGGALFTTWLIVLLTSGLAATVVLYFLLPTVLAAQSSHTLELARIWTLTTFIALLAQLANSVLLGDHDFFFVNTVLFGQQAAITIILAGLLVVDGLTVYSALVANAVAFGCGAAISTLRLTSRHRLRRPDLNLGKETVWFGLRAGGTDAAAITNARLDTLILPGFLAAHSVGLYSVATNVSWIVVAAADALAFLVLPAAARQRERGPGTVVRAFHATLVGGSALALAIGVTATALIPAIYGADFAASATPLRILLVGCVFLAASQVLLAGLYAANRPFTAAVPHLIGVAVTACGLAIFLPAGGIEAAALVSTAAYITVFVLALLLYKRVTGVPWRRFQPFGVWRLSGRRISPLPAGEQSADGDG